MSKEYWEDREKERLDLIDISVDERIKDIEDIMNNTVKKLENEILKLYEKYANDNELSYQEALLYLNDNERKEFQKDLKYYIETSKNREKSTLYRSELQALSTRARVKRLEVLKANIKIQSTELERLLMDEVPSTFNSIYQDSYFYNLYSQCLYTDNLGLRFDIPSPNIIKELLNNPWSGKNYSDKVWNITSNFNYKLDSVITSGLIRGEHPNIIAKNLKEATLGKRDKDGNLRGGKLYDCKRLVRTEAAFIAEQATKKSYDANNIKEYEYLATLDLRTSAICQSLDGKVFKVKDAVTGLNYPPMHCFCRSTTVPVIKWGGENDNSYERISRDPITGRNSYIDDIDYSDWKDKQYSKYNKDIITAETKKISNRSSDKKQYREYKEIVGADSMPESFDKFQKLKYNKTNEWELLKDYKKSRQSNMISAFTPFSDYKTFKSRIEKELIGLITSNGIEIKTQSKHFIERVVGTSFDPEKKRPRDGVDLNVIEDTLKRPLKVKEEPKKNSHKFIGEKVTVTINPYTGNLIQCNPTDADLVRRLKNV
ncbi:minor capsid protein [Paraclostridium bifermentans]|uniref:minor capsid protein n=1 Tax=Paraclostridium bifermentans TaxID=1490 RepID=UPI00359C5E0E